MTAAHSTKSLGRGFAALTFLAVLVLLAVAWQPCFAGVQPDQVLWLTPQQDRFSLTSHLQILEDPTGRLTIDDVSSPAYASRFNLLPGGMLSPEWEPATYWLRLTLASREPAEHQPRYFFDLAQPTIAAATLFAPLAGGDGHTAWREITPLDRYERPQHLPSQFSHFPLPALAAQPQTVFVRLRLPLGIEASPEIVTRTGLQQRILRQHLLSGAMMGILLLLIFNHLSIYFVLRYVAYLWYALLLITSSLFLALVNGSLPDLAPQVELFHATGIGSTMFGLTLIARVMFVRSFLPLKQLFPLGDRLAIVVAVFYLPVIFLPLLGSDAAPWAKAYMFLGLPRMLFFIALGLVCWRRGFQPARLYLLAVVPQMLGSLNFVLSSLGMAPPLQISAYDIQQLGIVCEAILLASALVQRVKVLAQERERLEQAAHRESLENQNKLRNLVSQLVHSEERQRQALAEDLHDGISQNLAITLFNLRLLAGGSPGRPVDPRLSEATDLLRLTLDQTRTLTFDISPPVLHDYGLAAALGWLAERFQQRHGLRVRFRSQTILPGREESLEVNLFRAVQELLVNVVKHAEASEAEVTLSGQGRLVTLRVSDDGRGLSDGPPEGQGPSGFGLFSIRERIQALGGSMEIQSSPGQGCSITLSLPWPEPHQATQVKGGLPDDDHSDGR